MDWDKEIKDKVYKYLDDLRESGITNMFGARPYLQEEFGFDEKEAALWLTNWMKDFGK